MTSVPLIKTVWSPYAKLPSLWFPRPNLCSVCLWPSKAEKKSARLINKPFFSILSHPANEDLHLTVEEWMEEIRIRHMPLASNEVLHAEEIRGRCGEIARQSGEMAKKVCKLGLHIMKHYYYQISPRFSRPSWQKERKKQTKRNS